MIEAQFVNVITHGYEYLVITLLDYKVGKVYYQFIVHTCAVHKHIFIAEIHLIYLT